MSTDQGSDGSTSSDPIGNQTETGLPGLGDGGSTSAPEGSTGDTSDSSGDSDSDGSSGSSGAGETFIELVVIERGICNGSGCPDHDENEWAAAATISSVAPDVLARVACTTGIASFGISLCLPIDLPQDGGSAAVVGSNTLGSETSEGALQVGPVMLSPIAGSVVWWYPDGFREGMIPEDTEVTGSVAGEALAHAVPLPGSIMVNGDSLEWDAGSTNAYVRVGDAIQHLGDSGTAAIPDGATRAFRVSVDEARYGMVTLRVVGLHIIGLPE